MHKILFTALVGLSKALRPLPPPKWLTDNSSGLSFSNVSRTIYIDSNFAPTRDTEGLTLIPPTAYEFAQTFREDISAFSGDNWTIAAVSDFKEPGIHLGRYRGDPKELSYENGVCTEEGYELEIANGSIYIGGSGARGMFWGTRTLLQQILIANGSTLAPGRTVDVPAYATRGYMLDCGRKYYTPEFLKELCSYASFFKVSEFHFHSSDNNPLSRGPNQTWDDRFSHFSLYAEKNLELRGLVQRKNESLSRADFEGLQKHCAQRGVTLVPEIEAPGHALSITKWKPELALAKEDLLNLSHPDTVPTIKAIWSEFLPWFQTKEVHIGADEYDSELADDYIKFVNEMASFINTTSGKRTRIWGTHEPSENYTISKDIIVQHWQYGQSDPIQLQADGYDFINSNDWWAYTTLKNDHTPIYPAPYPQLYNTTRTLDFANMPNWQWDPSLFNQVNTTEQPAPNARGLKGAILAAWNDNGPDATTQLEAYYAIREGIPLMAARAWSGARGVNVSGEWSESIKFLGPRAPAQNLDRKTLKSQSSSTDSVLLHWTRQSSHQQNVILGQASYGPPYTLTLNASSPFKLSGPDSTLSLSANTTSNDSSTSLMFTTADGFEYPLHSVAMTDGQDPGHPGRIWTNASTSSHMPVPITLPVSLRIETDILNGSRVWINDDFAGRFEVFVYGGRNTLFSWSQMAFVAPLERIEGGVDGLILED